MITSRGKKLKLYKENTVLLDEPTINNYCTYTRTPSRERISHYVKFIIMTLERFYRLACECAYGSYHTCELRALHSLRPAAHTIYLEYREPITIKYAYTDISIYTRISEQLAMLQ